MPVSHTEHVTGISQNYSPKEGAFRQTRVRRPMHVMAQRLQCVLEAAFWQRRGNGEHRVFEKDIADCYESRVSFAVMLLIRSETAAGIVLSTSDCPFTSGVMSNRSEPKNRHSFPLCDKLLFMYTWHYQYSADLASSELILVCVCFLRFYSTRRKYSLRFLFNRCFFCMRDTLALCPVDYWPVKYGTP